MARTKLLRCLPPLPSGSTTRRKGNKRGDFLQILREVALAAQGVEAKSFYTLRKVAQHFHLPLSTVARAYEELEKEGLLSRIRGSRTILHGTASTRRLFVPNVVAMPASLSCFMTLQDYRMFLIRTRREFRRRNLVTAITFYEDRSDAENLSERIQQARADVVVWYLPDTAALLTAPRLRDLGIHILGIGDGGLPSIPCHYEVRRNMAVRTILRDWLANGIRRVRIPRGESRSSADEERLEALLAETPLRWRFVGFDTSLIERFRADVGTQKDQAIIFLAATASLFLMRAPDAFNDLLRKYRVALLDGPVGMPLTPRTDAPVDLVLVEWRDVAKRIAEDILSREVFSNRRPVVFEATAKLRAPLNQFAQKI